MFFTNKSLLKLFLIGLLNHQVYAEDQQILFDHPASAQEIGNILFSTDNPGVDPAAHKMRSINMTKKNQSASASAQQAPSSTSVGLPIQFAYNSAELLPAARPYLDEIGKMLNLEEFVNQKLVIEGHTDASGSRSYNRQLSERRSSTVKNYLMTHFQIATQRLFVIGQGENMPIPGINPHNGANRRVQFYKAN